ncbi:SAM-dependent methyltransferase [Adhaeretor mobilis]|uniref:SAM-dependent methyltransferase n=1 Tax=Adhaeretor mobilis TaxID=1930276 RepID=A0A517MQ41_9BACT|nr:class I SAM-dependent methyltransferase [Adhaeretor mobilis]QDS97005.1 hypothetical protein HG15A2_02640 [Adhaeretor mobilis]
MTQPTSSVPYCARLMRQLAKDDAQIKAAFGKHVHWGYFEDPAQGHVSASDYGHAAEAMCLKLLDLAEITNGQRILDVGCGFGGTISCLNRYYSQVELIGLNINSQQLR